MGANERYALIQIRRARLIFKNIRHQRGLSKLCEARLINDISHVRYRFKFLNRVRLDIGLTKILSQRILIVRDAIFLCVLLRIGELPNWLVGHVQLHDHAHLSKILCGLA